MSPLSLLGRLEGKVLPNNSRVQSNPLAINILCTVCLKIISETCWTRGKFLRAPNLLRIMWQIQWRSVLRRYQTPEQLSCTLSTFQILFYNYELPTSCNLLRSSRVLSDLVSWNFLQISFSSFSQYFFVSSFIRRILTPISVLLKNGIKSPRLSILKQITMSTMEA